MDNPRVRVGGTIYANAVDDGRGALKIVWSDIEELNSLLSGNAKALEIVNRITGQLVTVQGSLHDLEIIGIEAKASRRKE